MAAWIKVIFLIVGLVNLTPAVGVLSHHQLQRLYGVAIEHPDLLLMMRHRAVLLGLVGALLVAAVWIPNLRLPACIVGLVSMLSYLVLAGLAGSVSGPIAKVATVDIVASVLLVVGLVGMLRSST